MRYHPRKFKLKYPQIYNVIKTYFFTLSDYMCGRISYFTQFIFICKNPICFSAEIFQIPATFITAFQGTINNLNVFCPLPKPKPDTLTKMFF
jgi:hypothetical protein